MLGKDGLPGGPVMFQSPIFIKLIHFQGPEGALGPEGFPGPNGPAGDKGNECELKLLYI